MTAVVLAIKISLLLTISFAARTFPLFIRLPLDSTIYEIEMNASACLHDLRNEIIEKHGHIFNINNENETIRIHLGRETLCNLNDALSDIGICAESVVEIEIIPKFKYFAVGIIVDYSFVHDKFIIVDVHYYSKDGLLPSSLPNGVKDIATNIHANKGSEINITTVCCNQFVKQMIDNLVQGTGYTYNYTLDTMDTDGYFPQRIIWTIFIKPLLK